MRIFPELFSFLYIKSGEDYIEKSACINFTKNKMMETIPFAVPFVSYKISEFYRRCFAPYVYVQTKLGPIRGLEITSSDFGYKYAQFLGVPYGKPPLGELRFKVSKSSISIRRNLDVYLTFLGPSSG